MKKPLESEELKGLLHEARNSSLGEESQERLRTMVDAYRYLGELAGEEGATIERVRERFFERYRIVPTAEAPEADDTDSASEAPLPSR